ncbi:hypothetical protein EHQ12_18385 [Leptospira gomenensis]|uniref:Uncharacterized protein n=1 Tax=Leptospira gomenensis TaxID=2484974 RepID=A0A5F1YQF8_9LEPT|nr:hypothetical protein [Leptospira gomenensis]TGK32579.1 hypothetical protein EHQ12_18385 [Leptospira gomenensis]TGK38310.1 hypothetical protein EHQ17_01260 [Leptospira gomenensis]TGK52124.1 hypothetical protein EHQ07_00685 [Leptospira gomenensis]TGK59827.1 hypothetical protein EHQ13_11370 [Leptospira gomenensis]
MPVQKRILFLPLLVSSILFTIPFSLFADTILLKDGNVLRNVRTKMGGDELIVEDEAGNIRKIETKLVKKIVMAEVQTSEDLLQTEKQPLPGKNSGNKKGGDFKNGDPAADSGKISYSSGISYWSTEAGEPDRIGNFSVQVQSVLLQVETRFEGKYGITLGFEHSSFGFKSDSNFLSNPSAFLLLSGDNIQKNESSNFLIGLSSFSEGAYEPFRIRNSFRIDTLSFLPGMRYYLLENRHFSWFLQFGFGLGRSYRSGMYTNQFLQGTLLFGSGIRWNGSSVFADLTFQYRNVLLSNPDISYRFSEPNVQISFGIRI